MVPYRRKNKDTVNKLLLLPMGWNVFFLAVLIIMAAIVIMPFLLIVIASFTSRESLANRGYSFFPERLTLEAYWYLLKTGDQILTSYYVSIATSVIGTAINLAFVTMFAYVLSQQTFPLRRPFTLFVVFPMLFSAGLVPSYILNTRYLHLYNNFWIFIFANASVPLVHAMHVVILRTFIKTSIPASLYESARIDGAGHFTAFFRIVLPLLQAGIAAVGLFSFVGRWNDWFTAMVFIDRPSLIPLQTMLVNLMARIDFLKNQASVAGTPDGMQILRNLPTQTLRMACTLVVALPMLAAYPFFQRYFVTGLTIGSVKE